ncbi:MAG: hypothetical protein HZA54_10755 [Planctomycetes bacterium]|nr:hypothetical protein [Planctomycetota bacterium]
MRIRRVSSPTGWRPVPHSREPSPSRPGSRLGPPRTRTRTRLPCAFEYEYEYEYEEEDEFEEEGVVVEYEEADEDRSQARGGSWAPPTPGSRPLR